MQKRVWQAMVGAVLISCAAATRAAGPGTAAVTTGPATEQEVPGVPVLKWGMGKECTFAGALEAALAPATGDNYDMIMGHSAQAFRTRWFVGTDQARWNGSAPVAELGEAIPRLEKALGLKLDGNWEEKADARGPLLQRLRAEIDAGRPTIVYDSGEMDCAVAYGYRDSAKVILVRDYWKGDVPEVAAEKVGPWFCFVRPEGRPLSTHDAAVAGLKATVSDWSHVDPPAKEGAGHYAYGAAAFDAWTKDLREFDAAKWGKQSPWHASWWGFDSLSDARAAGLRYLEDVTVEFTPAAQEHLKKAAAIYREETALCGKTFGEKQAFMGPWTGRQQAEWDGAWREREAKILEQMKEMEGRAVGELKAAVEAEEMTNDK